MRPDPTPSSVLSPAPLFLSTSTTGSVTPELYAQVRGLYDQGLYLQAYRLTEAGVPLEQWTGPGARVLAGRMLQQLGGSRAARLQWARAFRESPRDAEARYYFTELLQRRKGPLAVLDFLEGAVDLEAASLEQRADLLLARAEALVVLRDFEDAERWVKEALTLVPEHPWVHVIRASLLEEQDRREEALDAVKYSLSLQPLYRPAVNMAGSLLTHLGQDAEALELLSTASARLECSAVSGQLARLQEELGLYDDAWASWERALLLAPRLESKNFGLLLSMCSDTAYLRGDVARSIELAELSCSPFQMQVAARMAASTQGRRRLLPVRFVRQHHKTCAPATLASVAALWDVPVEHLQVAESICYDGTPAYQERHWAATTGWHVREFRVTWDSARALLDEGIAFTLTTQEPGRSHLQAVVGYDERRGTLLVRDPSTRHLVEFDTEKALEHFASCGPRGMALVPVARAARLDAVELPEASLYDALHQVDAALVANDRATATGALESMERDAPGHRLTCQAKRALAAYDDSTPDALAALGALREAYPDNVNYLMAWLGCLNELGRREELLAVLRERARDKTSHPMLWHALASELLTDAREEAQAERLLARTLRMHPTFAPAYRSLAQLRDSQLRRDEALRLYRAAACLESLSESHAWNYFQAAQSRGETVRALAFVKDRFERFGARNAAPARTLCRALEALSRPEDALEVLEQACALRPEDGELSLFAAEMHSRLGNAEAAARHLGSAEGRVRDVAWHRAAALLASARGEHEVSLGHWEQVLAREPLPADAHGERVRLLTDLGRAPEARAHLDAACTRFPHHEGLLHLRVDWTREHEPSAAFDALEALLAAHPGDARARRERASLLSEQGRREEALEELARAEVLEPRHPALHFGRGQVLEACGRNAEAEVAYRECLRLHPSRAGLRALMGLATTPEARRASLGFARDALEGMALLDDTVLTFEQVSRDVLSTEELGACLEALLQRHPDCWEAWVARLRHLLRARELDDALRVAEQATTRFSLLAPVWVERALVHRAREDVAGERAALEAACRHSPGWTRPACELSELLERLDEPARAREVLERVCRANPRDGLARGYLADLLWRSEEHDLALERLFEALRLDPSYGWGWGRLQEWAEERERKADAVAFARELCAQPLPDSLARLSLVELLESEGEPTREERLALLDGALESSPRMDDAHDARARTLVEAGRFDEALAACAPEAYGGALPMSLRGRAAWVLFEKGAQRDAVKAMEAVLEEEPLYGWGWQTLGEWAESLQDDALLRRAREALVRVSPEAPSPHVELAEVLAKAGDMEGAIAGWRRALELAPDYAYAATHLFDALLRLGRLDEAAQPLEAARGHAPEALLEARAVQLACARGDADAARRHVERTLAVLGNSTWSLERCVEAMRSRGWGLVMERAVDAAMAAQGGKASETLARAWAHQHAERTWTWRAWGPLRALASESAVGVEALGEYVERMGELGRTVLLALFLSLYSGLLRTHARAWGAMGYALMKQQRRARAWTWLRDWRARPTEELRAWMLMNVLVCGYERGHREEAEAALVLGLTLSEESALAGDMRVWRAFLTALRDDADAPGTALLEVKHAPEDGLLKLVLGLARTVQAARTSGARAAREALGTAEQGMPGFRSHPVARRAHRDAVARVRAVVGWRAWLRSAF
ncbi:tetratricopeptide repeat protein [Corallococcus terminator]